MGTFPEGHLTHVLEPPVDIGNWTELQAKLSVHCEKGLERLSEELSQGLATLEVKFSSYITPNSFKRSIQRR